MKRRVIVLAGLLFVATIMAISNPKEDEFVRWFDLRARGGVVDGGGGLVGTAMGAILSVNARLTVERTNYVFFSVFRTRVAGSNQTYLGIFGQVIGL